MTRRSSSGPPSHWYATLPPPPARTRRCIQLSERLLVHLEADAVAEAVEEAADEDLAGSFVQLRLVAVLVEEVTHHHHQVAAVDARLRRCRRLLERLLAEAVVLAQLVARRADDVRARHVRVHAGLAVAWKEIEDDRLVRQQLAGAH